MPTNTASQRLLELGGEAIDRYPPKSEMDGSLTTFCNVGLQYIAAKMGYWGFRNLCANDCILLMKRSADWAPIADSTTAQKLANDGRLVVCGLTQDPHGHVAAVMPYEGELPFSGHWNAPAPYVANVGKTNRFEFANWAFPSRPQMWAWVSDKTEVS